MNKFLETNIRIGANTSTVGGVAFNFIVATVVVVMIAFLFAQVQS